MSEQLTIGNLCEQFGLKPDAVRQRWNRHIKSVSGEPFASDHIPTEREREILFANKPAKVSANASPEKKKMRAVVRPNEPRVSVNALSPNAAAGQSFAVAEVQETPAFDLSALRDWTVDILLIALAVGHAWLIKYELSQSYGTYGAIGGWVAFGFICATVFLSADRSKNVTSTYALIFALVIDAAAVVLHYEHFRQFNAPAHITVAVCAFLGGMSWGALFLFRHKKNN